MKIFVIIMFGLAVVRSFSKIVSSIKEEDNVDTSGAILVFACMLVSYIWFLNLIIK